MAAQKILAIVARQVMKNLPYTEVVVFQFNSDNFLLLNFIFWVPISNCTLLQLNWNA